MSTFKHDLNRISHFSHLKYKRTFRIRKNFCFPKNKNFIQNFCFPKAPIWIKVLCNDGLICQLNKPCSNQNRIAEKQDFKEQSLYSNHRISFDTKGPISPFSEGNSYIMVIVDAFTHYVALNPEPHCNAYYAYTTLHEHRISKFGLPESLVTDNGTEFINNEIIT